MQQKKYQFVEQLSDGDRVEDVFQVASSRLGETRAGKPYLHISVIDRTGEIAGPVWDQAQERSAFCQVGGFVHITGQVQLYREKAQLRIDQLLPVDQADIDPADFMASSRCDTDLMGDELQKLIATVANPYLRKLLKSFFNFDELWRKFQTAPAAKAIHHAYVGGLLEHSLSTAKLADTVAVHYPGIDRSLLISGALLHDIGKLEELEAEVGCISYTDRGRLKGHLVIGSEMIGTAAAKIADFPEKLLDQLQHMILSHHGRLEFGSPAVPMTVEAYILATLDDLDAKMNLIEQLRRKQKDDGHSWSDYQRSLERYLYIDPLEDEEPAVKHEDDSAVRQQSLF